MTFEELIELNRIRFSKPKGIVVAYGQHGSCTWELNNLGQLFISPSSGGFGFLENQVNFHEKKYWCSYADFIKQVVVRKGVYANVNAAFLFAGLKNCFSVKVENLDVSYTKNFSNMFDGCGKIKSLELQSWNTSNAIDMSGMFYGCKNLETIVENFDTSNVRTMVGMFNKCKSLKVLNVNHFSIPKVQNISKMFASCKNLEKLDFSNLFDKNFPKSCERQDIFLKCKNFKHKSEDFQGDKPIFVGLIFTPI